MSQLLPKEDLEYVSIEAPEFIHGDINHSKRCHSCESRNPGKHWIPGQARNDEVHKTYVVMYN